MAVLFVRLFGEGSRRDPDIRRFEKYVKMALERLAAVG